MNVKACERLGRFLESEIMNEELDILKIVADSPNISQRKIAEQTGISLGQVNFLIKKCVKKGLIKIEGQTTKTIKYNLTPKGLSEKAALTMQYVKVSYRAIMALTDKIRSLIDLYKVEDKDIVVFGESGEMMEVCKLIFGNKVSYINQLSELEHNKANMVCVYWDYNGKNMAEIHRCKEEDDRIIWINILD